MSLWMHGHPSWMVARQRCVQTAHGLQMPRRGVFLVRPDFVGPHVGGVEVGFAWIEDGAVDGRGGRVGKVLHVAVQSARGGHGEDVAVAGVRVERGAVDCVGRLSCGEDEDGAGFGGGGGCECYRLV